MNKKRLLLGVLIYFLLWIAPTHGEEKALEIREIVTLHENMKEPTNTGNGYFFFSKNEIVVIQEQLIVYEEDTYHNYFLRDEMMEWNVVSEELMAFNHGNTVSILDLKGNVIDRYELENEENTILSYNANTMKFVIYNFDEEEMSSIYSTFMRSKVDNIWFISSHSLNSSYRLIGEVEFHSFFVDVHTGKRVSEIFTFANRVSLESELVYLHRSSDSFGMEGNALYDLEGNIIIPYTESKIGQNDYIGGFFSFNILDKYTSIEVNGKYGIFDIEERKMIIEPMYDDVFQLDDRGYFVVSKGNKYGVVDANNEVLFGFDYQRIHIDGNYIAIGWDNMVQLLDFKWNPRTDVYCQSPYEEMGNCRSTNPFSSLDLNEPYLLVATEEPHCVYLTYYSTTLFSSYPNCGGFRFYDKNGYNVFHSEGGSFPQKYGDYYSKDRKLYNGYGIKMLDSFERYYIDNIFSHRNELNELVLYNLDTKQVLIKTTGEIIEVNKDYMIVKENGKIQIYNGSAKYLGFVFGDYLEALGNDVFILTTDGKRQVVQIRLSEENWNKEIKTYEFEAPLPAISIVEEKPTTKEEEVVVEENVQSREDQSGVMIAFLIMSLGIGGYALYKSGYYKKIESKFQKREK